MKRPEITEHNHAWLKTYAASKGWSMNEALADLLLSCNEAVKVMPEYKNFKPIKE